ncbi:HNH endonuclease signature motif containing protein [Pseudonocardia petroleophila]|nr:HNH endonuclease signature motif containing protein [Pseudonocardia petroleophila]
MSPTRSSAPSEALLIERIALLEERKAAIAAEQSEAVLEFATAHAESQIAAGEVDPEALERSIAAQVGLACRVSPTEGRRRVRIARDLHAGHTRVRELFTAGRLSEYQTATIVAATAHLSPAERAEVDRGLAERRVETLGVRRIHDLTRSLAAQVAPEKFTARCRAARTGRRVSVRPAADGMADLTAHLPVEEAVACYAALAAVVNEAAVRPEPVTRGRGQIMADALVERLTGQATARDVNVEIQVVVPVEALVDADSPLPAEVPGHGPVPVELLTTGDGRRTWRRLITRDGVVIGGDSRSRLFTGRLAALIRARDGHRCREPYCDAPIRHIDHIRRWKDGGTTEFTNGRGLCAFHNHVREIAGWRAEVVGEKVTTTTPTGAVHHAEIAPAAGRPSTARPGQHDVA